MTLYLSGFKLISISKVNYHKAYVIIWNSIASIYLLSFLKNLYFTKQAKRTVSISLVRLSPSTLHSTVHSGHRISLSLSSLDWQPSPASFKLYFSRNQGLQVHHLILLFL